MKAAERRGKSKQLSPWSSPGPSAELIRTRDAEARRISRELHDGVGQMFAAINLNLQVLSAQVHKLDEAGGKAVAENRRLVAEIARELRALSHLLHPPLLDEMGLRKSLGWYIDDFSRRSNIQVNAKISENLAPLPPELETCIFFIVQECLTNIRCHSASKTAALTIAREADQITVVAHDARNGIPVGESPQDSAGRQGVGFRDIRERVRSLSGTLEIESSSTGFTVTATLPLRP